MRTVRDLLDLSGRVALVTGGAGHLGSAIAEALAEQGAALVLLDRPGAHSVFFIASKKLALLPVDLETVGDDWSKVPEFVKERFGRLDILVNCAALLDAPGLDVPFPEQSLDTWWRSLEVNLAAAFALTQACCPMLKASGHGSVINIASIYGMVGPDLSLYGDTGMGCGAAYAASKAGLLGLTRHLATVLAPSVRVNAITPGGVARGQDAGFVERYCARTPLGRMATEEDVKGAAAFLASDASGYVTGQNLVVDGGWTAW
jgi:NAD(P)-dependent dehydrogenase (short-subunit alcohol dehydrogenase family)